MSEEVLLIGNGINNVTNKITWKNLMKGLVDNFAPAERRESLKSDIDNDKKPLPILYEEILFSSFKEQENNIIRKKDSKNTIIKLETKMKNFIKEKINNIEKEIKGKNGKDNIHGMISELVLDKDKKINNILTTNYDKILDEAVGLSEFKNKGIIKEKSHNLFRNYEYNYNSRIIKFWHIHGIATDKSVDSICLGYDRYGRYIQKVMNYIFKKIDNRYVPLNCRLKDRGYNSLDKIISWVDFFFANYIIYIIGLSLDLQEMHLWWLLTYRKRRHLQNRISKENKVYYFCSSEDRYDVKLNLLENFGVDLVKIDEPYDDSKYYKEIIRRIKENKIYG